MTELQFITSNTGKYEEVRKKLSELEINVVKKDIGYPEIQVDSLEKVVEYGLSYLEFNMEGNWLIDDSGLFIESLNGFPGVYSAYVFKTIGCEGILSLMKNKDNRKAYFKSCMGLVIDNKKIIVEGICEGQIIYGKKGKMGFGYDPIFVPNEKNKTFAEMEIDEKNLLSHRSRALSKLSEHLISEFIQK